VHDDRKLFGKLVLDGFQAGLSWAIILRKRDAFLQSLSTTSTRPKMAHYDCPASRQDPQRSGHRAQQAKGDNPRSGNARAPS